MDTTFEHSYDCVRLTESTNAPIPHFYYPGASELGGKDGILLDIRPENAERWLGTFAFGGHATVGTSGVYTMPNPDLICVVSEGAGYVVSTRVPTDWEDVDAMPVTGVHPIRPQNLIVFADFTELVAYGAAGLQWRSERLAWDDLRVTEVTDTSIKGDFWHYAAGTRGAFEVELTTGRTKMLRPSR